MQSLAVKYRPQTFDDVVEQEYIKKILTNQLLTASFKSAYLFCGPAGCGKTTCARILASEINQHKGNPIEMDAASNNSVDDVRDIIQQARLKSIDSDYKVFIIDECHVLSNNAWQAMLKILEESPVGVVFIFCTTDPQKIPKTILSRVQRFDFSKIGYASILKQLSYIVDAEHINVEFTALQYIAKLSDGGMRDAITLLDKCVSYSETLSIDDVVKVLGTADYSVMLELTDSILSSDKTGIISVIETVYNNGVELKQFLSQYIQFVLDILKYSLFKSFDFLSIPEIDNIKSVLDSFSDVEIEKLTNLLDVLLKLSNDIKWSVSPKYVIESVLILNCEG